MGSTSQKLAQLVGQGSDVGARRTVDFEVDGVRRTLATIESMNADPLGRDFNLEPLPGQSVGAPPPDLLGRVWGRSLHLLADHGLDHGPEAVRRETGLSELGGGLTQAIVGIGGEAQSDGSLVDLPAAHEESRQSGGATDCQGQYTGGHGVESPQVADFLDLQLAADELNDLMRGHAFRFVDDQEARERSIHGGFGHRQASVRNRNRLAGYWSGVSTVRVCSSSSSIRAPYSMERSY